MTPQDNIAKTRAENALRESIRVAIKRTLTTLDMPSTGTETLRLVLSALRQVAQPLQIELDLEVDSRLGDGDWLSTKKDGGSDGT